MEYENTAGSLRISSEVVASIAEYAVKEVEGVACLAPIVSNIGGWLTFAFWSIRMPRSPFFPASCKKR